MSSKKRPWVNVAVSSTGLLVLALLLIASPLPVTGSVVDSSIAATARANLSSAELHALLNQPGPLWLVGADLSGANRYHAQVAGANLYKVNLQKTVLNGVDLTNDNLSPQINGLAILTSPQTTEFAIALWSRLRQEVGGELQTEEAQVERTFSWVEVLRLLALGIAVEIGVIVLIIVLAWLIDRFLLRRPATPSLAS